MSTADFLIPGDVTTPLGFLAGGIHCGVKRKSLDLALLTVAQQRQLQLFLLSSRLDLIKRRDRFLVDSEKQIAGFQSIRRWRPSGHALYR